MLDGIKQLRTEDIMSAEQLRRLEIINRYALLYPKVITPINYGEFAILNEDERNLCLKNAEKRIKNLLQERNKSSLN